ncbi:MAG: nucleotidyl transferase AbiEii/AbiGii toxin family protein [Actinobacteria bacterium]|nr:nucleotidyl transferase AbiEii/AbiGii toxin family protein [Actinomycetota bacterium]
MTHRELKNIPASVRARLMNHAKASGESYYQVLQYFAIERFLYRLSETEWGERFIVKGAIMLRAWGTPLRRPTRDIDFFGRASHSSEDVLRAVRECLAVEFPDDGLVFQPEVEAVEINSEEDYPGVRVVLRGDLDGGKFKLQLDISIDDAVVPDPEWVAYPTLLDLAAPRILAYRPETALAEKYQTIVSKGITNSRLRDYYDIWLLSRSHPFAGSELAGAIDATFTHRRTPLPSEAPSGLTEAFYNSPEARTRWSAFLTGKRVDAPEDLADVCEKIASFIVPPGAAAAAGAPFSSTWDPSGGWSE